MAPPEVKPYRTGTDQLSGNERRLIPPVFGRTTKRQDAHTRALKNLKELVKALEQFENLQGLSGTRQPDMDNESDDGRIRCDHDVATRQGLEFPAVFCRLGRWAVPVANGLWMKSGLKGFGGRAPALLNVGI